MILPVIVIAFILGSLLSVSYKPFRQLRRIETRLLKLESRIAGNNIEIANIVLEDFKREIKSAVNTAITKAGGRF